MIVVREGQCGLCSHFGQHGDEERDARLIEILATQQASETLIASCGNEKLQGMHLRVTPASGCDGFEAAA